MSQMIIFGFTGWDMALVAAVSLMCIVVAYVHTPRLKTLMLLVPIPFTIASLSLGKPIDTCNITAPLVLLAYTHAVRVLHYSLRWKIIPSIVASAIGYCLVGSALSTLLPRDPAAFWTMTAATTVIGVGVWAMLPKIDEPGHRTPLPAYIKVPIIICVILTLVLMKKQLQGFVAMFPMVGVVAAYEARSSLWMVCRHVTASVVMYVPMVVAIYLAQTHLSFGWSLAVGWAALLTCVVPYVWAVCRDDRPALATVSAD